MKKFIALIIAAALCFAFCSCGTKSPEQELAEARKAAKQAKEAADAARDNYNQLLQDIEDYEKALERVQNAK